MNKVIRPLVSYTGCSLEGVVLPLFVADINARTSTKLLKADYYQNLLLKCEIKFVSSSLQEKNIL